MRFLADENFPRAAVEALRDAGHDVIWIRTTEPGAPDQAVLDRAAREQRILLTFDKDFGELAGNSPLPRSSGIVLFRLRMPKPADVGASLARLICERTDWAGHFSVIEPGRLRMRSLR
ncbi:MAG TPA: DUF5615 family PIN-like protein [Stellaceae bacterium]|jgi:hypothetical protein|nr:DUF5615 family PIN-like protein [Stellaceae bacterium]